MSRPVAAACAAMLIALAAPLSAQVLERIAEGGEIRLGVRADAAPLSYEKDGAPAGYTVDLCLGVVEGLGAALDVELTPAFVAVTAEDRFDKVASGEIDLLCGAASVTLARRELVDFSIPVFVDGATVVMRRDAMSDFKGLAGKAIGVRDGTTTQDRLGVALSNFDMSAEVMTVADHQDGLDKLLDGSIAAYFADQSILMALLKASDQRERLVVAGNVLSIEPQALALPLGDSAFRLAVDRELSRMYRSGAVAQVFEANFAPAVMGDVMKALVLTAPIPD
jgi:polar amino acid transport system substrate-binding protein/glutamate/aspartate transport system substrate-binding protein